MQWLRISLPHGSLYWFNASFLLRVLRWFNANFLDVSMVVEGGDSIVCFKLPYKENQMNLNKYEKIRPKKHIKTV